jgi:DNA-binding NtrC family response regulator
MKQRALLICPVHPVRQQLIEVVRQTGATHVVISSVREATKALKNGKYDIIVTGRKLGDGNSDDLLQAAQVAQAGTPVVVVSRTGDWNEYIDAIDRGHSICCRPTARPASQRESSVTPCMRPAIMRQDRQAGPKVSATLGGCNGRVQNDEHPCRG